MSEDTFKIYSPRSAVALVARMRSMLYAVQSTASARNPKSALGETFEDLMDCVDEFISDHTSDNKEDGVTSEEICAEAIVHCPICGAKITVGESYGDDNHCDECDRIIERKRDLQSEIEDLDIKLKNRREEYEMSQEG